MNPKEGTSAHVVRARGHLVWDTEIGVSIPNTGLVDAEHGEVLGLDLRGVTLVRNGQGAALDVAQPGRVEFRGGRARAGGVGIVGVLDIAAF